MRQILTRQTWRFAPAALAAAFLLYGWTYVAWNGTVGAVFPRIALHLKRPIGFDEQPRPDASWSSMLDGTYQRAAATRIGVFTPIYRDAVRWKNQVYYSAFGISGVPDIVVGRDRELFQKIYVDRLCGAAADGDPGQPAARARQLRAAQDRAEARGQVFVYLTTPSKPAVYPEWLPKNYPCPGGQPARDARLTRLRDALAEAGVHVADAVQAVEAARYSYPTTLFPRGGIHWNTLGAAIGASTLVDAVGRPDLLAPFTFTVDVSDRPEADDRDVLDILNLRWPDARYPVPRLTIKSPPQPCRPVHIVEVTGSFIFKINDVLGRTACPPAVDAWFYWGLRHYTYASGGERVRVPEVDDAVRAEQLDHADIIIVEENETGAGEAPHVRDYLAWEQARQAQALR